MAQTILPNKFLPFPCAGPITRTVDDAALLLAVMAGPDNRDPLSLPATGEDFCAATAGGVRGARIAFSVDLGFAPVADEIAEIVRAATAAFREQGALVDEVELECGNPEPSEWVIWRAVYATLQDIIDFDRWADTMSPELVDMSRAGNAVSTREYLGANTAWSVYYDKLRHTFETYHFLLTPTIACEPFAVDVFGPTTIAGRPSNPILGWLLTYPFNFTGHPACSIPCGFTRSGLPVGLQIVGRRHADGAVLRASKAFEEARPWAGRRPELRRGQ